MNAQQINFAFLGFILSAGLSSTTHAQEFEVELGMFPAQPCSMQKNLDMPNFSNEYRQRLVRVKAKIFVEPINSRTNSVVEACVQGARNALRETQSFENIKLFGEIFQQYLYECTRRADVGVQSIKSLLVVDSQCQR
jgi:hypothetical protein